MRAALAAMATLAFGVPVGWCAGPDLRVGYFNNYLPSELEANVIQAIAEKEASLGTGRILLLGTDVTPAWLGLQRGDTDVLVEVDLPNQQTLLDKASATVALLSRIYADAGEGFFVPRYLIEGPAARAPGLRRVDQLPAYKAVFDGTLYDGSPGWQSTRDNALRMHAYGIDFRHLELSDAALIAMVTRATERREPIVFFFYHPHWLFRRFDLVKLEEPVPYHPGCFTGGDDRCAVPSFSAWVAARKDLSSRVPRLYGLLRQFALPLGEVEEMMLQVNTQKMSSHDVARAWLARHQTEVDAWVAAAGRP
jgi:glycine betaine/proline transport system substrate-binding protein